MKGKVPKKWRDKSNKGTKKVPGTPCVPMKTPIAGEIWDLEEMISTSPKVTLVIDLNFKEYFTPEMLERHGLQYKKIKANFGDHSLSTFAVDNFIQTVKEFARDDEEGEAEIAVICTYGTNRSGYLICRYLMEVLEMDPGEAIEQFEKARGEGFDPNKPAMIIQLLKAIGK